MELNGGNHDQIWGRTDSSNVQKVLWCCGELALDFDRLDFGGKFGGIKKSLIST
jgi:glutathione S-transferase